MFSLYEFRITCSTCSKDVSKCGIDEDNKAEQHLKRELARFDHECNSEPKVSIRRNLKTKLSDKVIDTTTNIKGG